MDVSQFSSMEFVTCGAAPNGLSYKLCDYSIIDLHFSFCYFGASGSIASNTIGDVIMWRTMNSHL